jgi:hypothetical protein
MEHTTVTGQLAGHTLTAAQPPRAKQVLDDFRKKNQQQGVEEKFNPKFNPVFTNSPRVIVHHVFENKYYERKGNVWGPSTVEDVHRLLSATYGIEEVDDRNGIITRIRNQAQIFAAVIVAGKNAGVHCNKLSEPYLVLKNHQVAHPVQGDWSIIREIIESMFGPEQTLYLYGWLQWAYRTYAEQTLAPGQMLVIVGDQGNGKTLLQEKIFSPLLGSTSAKALKYLTDATEFNSDLIANCHWALSDSISDLDYAGRKTLTERCKEALVNSEQRLRGLYSNPLTVDMVPRITCTINPLNIGTLPLFEDGMSDKMMLLKSQKSSRLPTSKEPRDVFEAKLADALPGFAYFLFSEFLMPEELKETEGNVRFYVQTYHHPEIREAIEDVKRHVRLAEMLVKWRGIYPAEGSSLDIWVALTKHNADSASSIKALAGSERPLGNILKELVKATKNDFCHGIKVTYNRGHDGRRYSFKFEENSERSKKLEKINRAKAKLL